MRFTPVCICLFLLITSSRTFAWGKTGHHMIIQIAKSQLSKEVVEMVDYYLKGQNWEEASMWVDDAKNTKGEVYTKNWHTVYIPKDQTYVAVKQTNLFNQTEFHLRLLDNRSLYPINNISEAIKALFHLVADLHQPLNCGYPEDKGGTTIPVKYNGKTIMLSDLWSENMLENKVTDMWACSKLLFSLDQKQKSEIQKISISEWVTDTRKLLPEVYSVKGGIIDQDYIDKNKKALELQLVKAGLRLAAVMNKYFRE